MQAHPNPSSSRLSESRLLVILVLAGILLSCLFGLRALHSLRHIRQAHPRPGEVPGVETIRSWMTIEYISRVYQVPQDYLFTQSGIPVEPGNEHKSLSFLNRQYYRGRPGFVVDAVQTAVSQYRDAHGLPPAPPDPPPPLPPTP
jgi:hypothetical protein